MVKNQYGEEIPERLDLAYREISSINTKIIDRFGPYVKELDLSNNNLEGDLTILEGFKEIHTLVLDNNRITSHSKFAILPKVHTLWINSNQINNLSVFIDRLKESFVNLKALSMLKNEACPNYFNGHSLKDYKDYRYFVISKIKTLQVLDVSPITDQEREESEKVYGNGEGTISLSKVTGPTVIKPKEDENKEDDPKLKRIELERKKKADLQRSKKEKLERREKRKKLAEEKADKKLKKEILKKEKNEIRKAKEKEREDEFTDSEDESNKILDKSSPKLPVFSSEQAPLSTLPPPNLPTNRKAYGDNDEADDEALTNNTQDSESDRDLPIHNLKLNNNNIHLPPPNNIKKDSDDDQDDDDDDENQLEDDDEDDSEEEDDSSEWSSEENIHHDDDDLLMTNNNNNNNIPTTLKRYEEDDDESSYDDDEDD